MTFVNPRVLDLTVPVSGMGRASLLFTRVMSLSLQVSFVDFGESS